MPGKLRRAATVRAAYAVCAISVVSDAGGSASHTRSQPRALKPGIQPASQSQPLAAQFANP